MTIYGPGRRVVTDSSQRKPLHGPAPMFEHSQMHQGSAKRRVLAERSVGREQIDDETVERQHFSDDRTDAPVGLSASWEAVDNRIRVVAEWDAFDGVMDLELIEDVQVVDREVVEADEGQVRFDDVRPNTTYTVRARARRSAVGRLSEAAEATVTTGVDTTPPEQVGGVVVSAGVRSVVVQWDEVPDADVAGGSGLYEVQLDTDDTFVDARVARAGGTLAAFSDLASNTIYHARVRAVDESGNAGDWSLSDSAETAAGTGRDFEENPIEETEIDDGAVSTPKLQANAVEAGKVAADAITGEEIKAGSITALDGVFATAAIVTADIGDAEITDAKIVELDVDKLTAGTLTSQDIVLDGGVLSAGDAFDGVFFDAYGIRMYDGGALAVDLPTSGTAEFSGDIVASDIEGSSFYTEGADNTESVRLEDGRITLADAATIEGFGAGRVQINAISWWVDAADMRVDTGDFLVDSGGPVHIYGWGESQALVPIYRTAASLSGGSTTIDIPASARSRLVTFEVQGRYEGSGNGTVWMRINGMSDVYTRWLHAVGASSVLRNFDGGNNPNFRAGVIGGQSTGHEGTINGVINATSGRLKYDGWGSYASGSLSDTSNLWNYQVGGVVSGWFGQDIEQVQFRSVSGRNFDYGGIVLTVWDY